MAEDTLLILWLGWQEAIARLGLISFHFCTRLVALLVVFFTQF
ncbi:hypothetical protein [Chroococcidiopsis sp [FACHB-1243]]|nr:hypothetical protein [Chroococcidiopsis sp. [FACHB-1243]]